MAVMPADDATAANRLVDHNMVIDKRWRNLQQLCDSSFIGWHGRTSSADHSELLNGEYSIGNCYNEMRDAGDATREYQLRQH